MKLAGYGEDRLVREITASIRSTDPTLLTGPGDDCAVVRGDARHDQLLKTDAVVEGIHFTADADPAQVGWKALCRAISDVAAMGGEPSHALITLAVPGERPVAWVRGLYTGLRRAARQYGVTLVGGETTRSPGPVFISVALTGRVKRGRAVLRSGGLDGDALLVTGRLGGSIAGWHLCFTPRLLEARWLVRNVSVHAMMDLSDGLGADLPRLALASGLAYEIDRENLPCRAGVGPDGALNDGEDYELLLAVSPGDVAGLLVKWRKQFPSLPLTCIGRLKTGAVSGKKVRGGFQHF